MGDVLMSDKEKVELFYYEINIGDGHFRFRSSHNFEGGDLALEHAYKDSEYLDDVQVISVFSLNKGLVHSVNIKNKDERKKIMGTMKGTNKLYTFITIVFIAFVIMAFRWASKAPKQQKKEPFYKEAAVEPAKKESKQEIDERLSKFLKGVKEFEERKK